MKKNRRSIFKEFVDFFKQRKSFWLVPLIVVLLVLLGLVVLGGTSAAPFIYTMF